MTRTFQRLLVGLVSLTMVTAPFVSGPARANICGEERGFWRIADIPSFKKGPQTLADYEVDRSTPNNIMVTNGTAVLLSTDSACTWKQVFTLPDSPTADSQATAANSEIRSIDISEPKRGRVLLMIEEQTPLGARPHVLRSDDLGATWASGDVGLPPQGAPETLVLPAASPDLAYLGIDVGGGSIDLIFASIDGGATWTMRSNPAALSPSMGIEGFKVDPLVSDSLWAWGTGGLFHSTDGGGSFAAIEDFIGSPVAAIDLFHAGSLPARIGGYIPSQARVLVSEDNGETWLGLDTPMNVDSAANGDDVGAVFVTAGGQMFSFDFPSQGWLNLQAPRSGLLDAATDRGGLVYARTSTELLSYDGPTQVLRPGGPGNVFQPGQIDPPREFQEHDPILRPARRRVALDPGQSRTITYDLALSKTPLPVNVFFLLDTSDSMGTTIEDLSRSVVSITNLLNEENFLLKIGVGAYRAFPDHLEPRPPCGEELIPDQPCEKNYVFKNFYDIAPASDAVEDILGGLESDAGGFYKSHLQALHTLATGQYVDVYPPGPDGGDVPAGEGATFDREAYRVVIHATDEAFWKGDRREGSGSDFGRPEPPPTPLFDEVEAALDSKQIMQVGLSIGSAPRKDLREVAQRTGALAPAGGVDCGRNHFLEEGEPLVCPVSRNNLTHSHNLVPAIVNMIENLPAGVDVGFSADGDRRIVKKVTPTVTNDVVLQVANDMSFDVTYKCPVNLRGKRFNIDLSATNLLDDELLDDARTRVVCREEPELPPVIPPVVTVSLAALAIPPPPPPPPAQLTSASQAQSQAQAQTGAVFEEEKEPQLAIAAAYREAAQMENDYEYEMVAYEARKQPVSPFVTLGAGAAMASMAYAGMMIHRTRQRRFAFQYQRRR